MDLFVSYYYQLVDITGRTVSSIVFLVQLSNYLVLSSFFYVVIDIKLENMYWLCWFLLSSLIGTKVECPLLMRKVFLHFRTLLAYLYLKVTLVLTGRRKRYHLLSIEPIDLLEISDCLKHWIGFFLCGGSLAYNFFKYLLQPLKVEQLLDEYMKKNFTSMRHK